MEEYTYKYSKYKFKNLPLLVLSEDGEFYRLPFESHKRYFNLKKLEVKEHKGHNKLLYAKKRYTKKDLQKLKYPHVEVISKERNQFYTPDYEDPH